MTVLVLASFTGELEKAPLFRGARTLFGEKQHRLFQNAFGNAAVRFGITGEGRGNVKRFFEIYFAKAGSHDLPGMVIATGFAGALNPSLKAGAVVAAREVIDLSTGRHYLSDVPAVVTGRFPLLSCLSVDRFMLGEGKASLARDLPQAGFIDMESAAVAETCSSRRIPWLVLRAVSDPVDFKFPSQEFVQDSWRRISIPRLALSLFRKPSDIVRTLAFQNNLARARKNIACAVLAVLEGTLGPF